jgi:hypothetical protein
MLCESYRYKNSEIHNEINDKPRMPNIKFLIDNPISKNQRYWKLNFDLLFVSKQEPGVFEMP